MYSSTLPRTTRLCLCNVITLCCLHWVWVLAIHVLVFVLALWDEPIVIYFCHTPRCTGQAIKHYTNLFSDTCVTFHHFWGEAIKYLTMFFHTLLLTILGIRHRKCLKSIVNRKIMVAMVAKWKNFGPPTQHLRSNGGGKDGKPIL